MNELALFAGAGGGILGTKLLGWRVVCAVEINPYCREVLLRRQEEGILEAFPIWDDVRTFNGKPWRGKVDVVTGGFPCQPWSVAGRQRGESDERNLWPDTLRIVGEVRPEWVFLENVPALLAHGYFGTILRDLSQSGYDAKWKVISAAEVGAPHLRNRVWIVAHTKCERLAWLHNEGNRIDLQRLKENLSFEQWEATPRVHRRGDGLAYYMERINSLGEGQVPAVVRAAWELLSGRGIE